MKRIVLLVLLMVTLPVAAFPQSNPVYKETILHNFGDYNDEYYPGGVLTMDRSGNLYGTTTVGVLYELSQGTAGVWNYSVLFNYGAYAEQGYVVMDHAGNLYGAFGPDIFQFSPQVGGWDGNRIYSFGSGGISPLMIDASGNLYGTLEPPVVEGKGYVFRLSPLSDGSWTMTRLHDFNGRDGAVALTYNGAGALIMDASGNLYGTTAQGGFSTQCELGCGVIFKLTNFYGTWREKVLKSFSGTDGFNPAARLMMDASGNLYGTTIRGGAYGAGVVFKTSFVGGKWRTTTLHSFTGTNGDGAFANTPLIMDQVGNIFGTTASGGGSDGCNVWEFQGCGSVFALKSVNGTWKETVIHHFNGRADGAFPNGVIFGPDGALYGSALAGGRFGMGLVYRLSR